VRRNSNNIPKILTLVNSFVVGATYFESVNNFLWHNRVIDHQLSDYQNNAELALLLVGGFLCGFISISNQQAITPQTAKFLNGIFGTDFIETMESSAKGCRYIYDSGVAAKALISSSSLLSSIRDLSGEWVLSGIIAGLALLGNFGATFVILKEQQKDEEGKPWRANFPLARSVPLAALISTTYALSQAALYSNALFNPFLLTGAISKRPGYINSDAFGRKLMMATTYPWIEFSLGTWQSIYNKSKKVLGSEIKETEAITPSCYQYWRGSLASVYRTTALLAAVFCFFYLLADKNPIVAGIITAFCSLATPGVFAILFPSVKSRVRQSENHLPLLMGNSASINQRSHEEINIYDPNSPGCLV